MKFKSIKMKEYAPFLRNASYPHLQSSRGKYLGNKVALKAKNGDYIHHLGCKSSV